MIDDLNINEWRRVRHVRSWYPLGRGWHPLRGLAVDDFAG
jgi:hypothetical protein